MNGAPSVEYPAGRCAFQARLEVGLAGAWLLTQILWLRALEWTAPPGAWWFSAGAGLAAVAAARWRARNTEAGLLCWQSPRGGAPGRWSWRDPAGRETALVRLSWAIDLQHHVLLRLDDGAGACRWVWLEQRSAPAAWDALRRALVYWREHA